MILAVHLGQPADARRQADGGDRHPADADAQPVGGGGLGQRGQQRSRFASGSPIPMTTTWLSRSSGASRCWSCSICSTISPLVRLRTTPSMPAGAERAAHAAADLGADADRAMSPVVAEQHALDPLPVGEFQEQFFGAVGGLAVRGDPRGPDLEIGGQAARGAPWADRSWRRTTRPASRRASGGPGPAR